jgi:DNA polymerase-3 subunit epsilon
MENELLTEVVILSEDTEGEANAVPLVAHNARFDCRCLREVFRCYRMNYPEFVFHDTLGASRRHFGEQLENHQLQTVAAACGYDLTDHHHALADAEACAWIAREIL